MTKRIKLLIDISGIDEGVSHLIYRNDIAPVPTEAPLIEVKEREVLKRALTQDGEVLTQDVDNPFIFYVSRVYMMMPMPRIYIDGVEVVSTNLTLYPKERKIRIDGENIPPSTTQIITMNYSYLVSVIEDDYTSAQLGVQHYGSHNITGINPPQFVAYQFDKITRDFTIKLQRDATAHGSWYRVLLREDRTGRVSEPSIDQWIEVSPNLYDLKYRLEISRDEGVTWEHLYDFAGYETTLSLVNDITGYAHEPVTIEVNRLTGTTAEVIFQNPWYKWELNHRKTHFYRVREEDVAGEISDFHELPRGGMNYKPTELKIRRKEHNGSPAMYEGFDAIDMWTLTEADVDITQPTIRLVDDHLVTEKEYSYTFFIDDEKGFRSNAFMQTTEM